MTLQSAWDAAHCCAAADTSKPALCCCPRLAISLKLGSTSQHTKTSPAALAFGDTGMRRGTRAVRRDQRSAPPVVFVFVLHLV